MRAHLRLFEFDPLDRALPFAHPSVPAVNSNSLLADRSAFLAIFRFSLCPMSFFCNSVPYSVHVSNCLGFLPRFTPKSSKYIIYFLLQGINILFFCYHLFYMIKFNSRNLSLHLHFKKMLNLKAAGKKVSVCSVESQMSHTYL